MIGRSYPRYKRFLTFLVLLAFIAITPTDIFQPANAEPPFLPDVRITTNSATRLWGGYRAISTAVAPNGTVYVAWQDNRISSPLDVDIYFSWSLDSGQSFPHEKRISDSPDRIQDLNPVVAVDERGTVYVVWGNSAYADGGVRFTKSDDGGQTFSKSKKIDDPNGGFGGRPDIFVDSNGIIHIAYEGGWGDADVFYTRSTDRGVSWGDGMVNYNDPMVNDPVNDSTQSSPRLAVDLDGNINVVWADNRLSEHDADAFFSRSTDGGRTFTPDIRLNDENPGENDNWFQDISTGENGEIYVIVSTGVSTRKGIYFYKSVDGGVTFNDGIMNDNDPNIADMLGRSVWSASSIITDASGRINVVYSVYNAIHYTNSTDQGDNFGDGIPYTDPIVQDGSGFSRINPHLDVDSCGNVYVIWLDDRNNGNLDYDVYASKLDNLSTDLSVFNHEMIFTPSSSIMLGSPVSLSSIVHNYCTQHISQTTVRFFLGRPSSGQQIGSDATIVDMHPLGGSAWANKSWLPTTPGDHEICVFVDPDNTIVEFNERNNIACSTVHVALPPIDPPRNLTAKAVGGDIMLEWEPPISPYVDHYLIYRSESQQGFDFGDPAFDTQGSANPLTTSWLDPLASSPSAPQEYYYVIRASNSTVGSMSATSNSAGKWTKFFGTGLNAFSLPLEPRDRLNMSTLIESVMDSVYGRWMSADGNWVTHRNGMGVGYNDTELLMGRAYEIFVSNPTYHTFCGYPASMIRFDEGLSNPDSYIKSLDISVSGNDVMLSWNATSEATEFTVLRADERSGLHDPSLSPLVILPSSTISWRDTGALSTGSEFYYMVVIVNNSTSSSISTYSIGVVTMTYLSGSDTFALPLDSGSPMSLDDYCDMIEGTVGLAYVSDQKWRFHAIEMPKYVYDTALVQGMGYQISTSHQTQAVFVGI